MRGLDPIVQALVPAVIDTGTEIADADVVAAHHFGGRNTRHTPTAHQLLEKALCCASIPAAWPARPGIDLSCAHNLMTPSAEPYLPVH